MSEIAIKVEGLGKRYRIGAQQQAYRTLREKLNETVLAPFRAGRHLLTRNGNGNSQSAIRNSKSNLIWALRDVSFEIKRGEVVGIIGRNGAGKSTLLKILSRITEPTEGYADIRGRIASLLEVGTGFHPELTGRENIFLNGSILGMKRAEIKQKFDEIVAFAEIEKFIDTPVKYYSSGMYVRLAFAVAAHLDPEILLVDEVLAVGDGAFQKKCLGKMSDVAKEGRTVLFVSHNMQAISTLTNRAVLFDTGNVVFDGATYSALGQYRSLWNHTEEEYVDPNKSRGVVKARVITSEPNQIHQFGKPLVFEFDVAFDFQPKAGGFSFQVVDEDMRPIIHLWLFDSDRQWARDGKVSLRCAVPEPLIAVGRYSLVTWVSDRSTMEVFESLNGICPFEVVMDGIPRDYEWRAGDCTYIEKAEWDVIAD